MARSRSAGHAQRGAGLAVMFSPDAGLPVFHEQHRRRDALRPRPQAHADVAAPFSSSHVLRLAALSDGRGRRRRPIGRACLPATCSKCPMVAALLIGVVSVLDLFKLARKTQCRLVRRRGHRATVLACCAPMEQHGLLPVADAVVADDLQLVERIHAQSDERRLADDPVRRSLYLVRMAGHEPQPITMADTRERP